MIKYNETFGTVNVPYTHFNVGDEYASVAMFCYHVRQKQGRLPKERYDQLTSMGFLWEGAREEKQNQRWEEMYKRLVNYKRKYSDCKVPIDYRDKELALWVKNQRSRKRKEILKEERIDKLNSIGFVWVVSHRSKYTRPDLERKWEARRQQLIQYHKDNGDYWVPRDYKNKNNPLNPLAYWAEHQRYEYKKGNLRKDRIKLLDEIGFPWDSKKIMDQKWDKFFNELKEVLHNKRSIGQINGKVFTRKILGDPLYGWIRNQRMLNEKGTLKPERKELLDNIGFEWVQVSDTG